MGRFASTLNSCDEHKVFSCSLNYNYSMFFATTNSNKSATEIIETLFDSSI